MERLVKKENRITKKISGSREILKLNWDNND